MFKNNMTPCADDFMHTGPFFINMKTIRKKRILQPNGVIIIKRNKIGRKGECIMFVKTITKENIDEALKSKGVVLLDFYADWCGPCQMLSPIIEQIAQENPDCLVGKINVDTQPELARRFDIVSIPTLAVIKGGTVANKKVGLQNKRQILDMLQ